MKIDKPRKKSRTEFLLNCSTEEILNSYVNKKDKDLKYNDIVTFHKVTKVDLKKELQKSFEKLHPDLNPIVEEKNE